MERRGFLKAGTAGFASLMTGAGLLSWTPRSEAATISKTLYITGGTRVMPDGVSVYIKGFSDSSADLNVPATSIICQEGDTLVITVINRLAVTHNFVILSLLASSVGIDLASFRRFRHAVAAITELDITKDRTRVVRLNDMCHLDGLE